MKKRLGVIIAVTAIASTLAAPASVSAKAVGADCVKFENLIGPSMTATASNGLTVTIDAFEYKEGNEVVAFSWDADGVTAVTVKAGAQYSPGDLSGYYSQANNKGISNIVFCGDPGDGPGDDNDTSG